MTEQQYSQQRAVILESKDLYFIPEPEALKIASVKPSTAISFLPIYSAIASAAAAVLVSYFVFKEEKVITLQIEKPVYITGDTVFIEKFTTDTLIQIQKQFGSKKVTLSKQNKDLTVESSSTTFTMRPESLPVISTHDLKNRGESIANDKTIALVEGRKI
jgi:hypothetical protein